MKPLTVTPFVSTTPFHHHRYVLRTTRYVSRSGARTSCCAHWVRVLERGQNELPERGSTVGSVGPLRRVAPGPIGGARIRRRQAAHGFQGPRPCGSAAVRRLTTSAALRRARGTRTRR